MKKTQRYAVVDLEATGTGAAARIIQVGIVVLEAGQIVASYATDVNPHERLDAHIISLTGISDAQLAQAPPFSQVAGEIFALLDGATFVAHNVQFDANLLAEHLFMEGYELRGPRVDTVELAQMLFPTLDKYGLGALSQALGLPLEAAHTAIDDATATAHLFLRILDKLASLPRQTLLRLAALSDNLIYETGELIHEALTAALPAEPAAYEEVAGVLVKPDRPSRPWVSLPKEFGSLMTELGLAQRPQQEEFANLVAEGLTSNRASFIEGPAGLGKTLGYLLPLLSDDSGRQIQLAVPTKLLQDQLLAGDLARLEQAYGLPVASIKSPRNYLSLEVFVASLNQQDSNRLLNRYKMQLLVWLLETETGDLDEISQKQGLLAYFDQLRHRGKLVNAALFGQQDFWERAKRLAASSQVVVTNHAFLLAGLMDDPEGLRDVLLVVDEAQSFVLAMEKALQGRLDLGHWLLTNHQVLQGNLPLLERRLLERLEVNLNQLVLRHRRGQSQLPSPVLEDIRRDVAESQSAHVEPLRCLFLSQFVDYWLESQQLGTTRQTDLVGASLDLLDFSQFLLPTTKAYLISATVTISKRIKLPDLLGIADYDLSVLAAERRSGQAIWLDEAMPDLEEESAYHQALAQRLKDLVGTGLPVLALFTSQKSLQETSELLAGLGQAHLSQTRDGKPAQLKKRFERGDSPLLLAMGAFWEGADFASLDRQILVITRLPFDNPKATFIKKINRYLKDRGKHPFYDYALPVVNLRLRQALGRVNRRPQQASAVLILDNRVLTRPYGKTIQRHLEGLAVLKQEKFDQILSDLQDFCYNEEDSN